MQSLPPDRNRSYLEDVTYIQSELAENEFAGYLHIEGAHGDDMPHTEYLIVAQKRVIKPITWGVRPSEIKAHHFEDAAVTDLYLLAGKWLSPQSDRYSCASLSLVYLKQLLKDDARQLKELCFIFPYIDSNNHVSYFFIPSPQTLRYSQSSEYNRFVKALVEEEHPGSFSHNGRTVDYNPLRTH